MISHDTDRIISHDTDRIMVSNDTVYHIMSQHRLYHDFTTIISSVITISPTDISRIDINCCVTVFNLGPSPPIQ